MVHHAKLRNTVNFNSQPHEEADIYCCQIIVYGQYFNSQPHEEADAVVGSMGGKINISTHSLTKRLTAILDKNTFI